MLLENNHPDYVAAFAQLNAGREIHTGTCARWPQNTNFWGQLEAVVVQVEGDLCLAVNNSAPYDARMIDLKTEIYFCDDKPPRLPVRDESGRWVEWVVVREDHAIATAPVYCEKHKTTLFGGAKCPRCVKESGQKPIPPPVVFTPPLPWVRHSHSTPDNVCYWSHPSYGGDNNAVLTEAQLIERLKSDGGDPQAPRPAVDQWCAERKEANDELRRRIAAIVSSPRRTLLHPEAVIDPDAYVGPKPTLRDAARRALAFMSTLNLQDHSVKEQRELLACVRGLMEAMKS